MDARRNLAGACSRWYPVVRDLHRFFIAIARTAVNADDGGSTAPHPLVFRGVGFDAFLRYFC